MTQHATQRAVLGLIDRFESDPQSRAVAGSLLDAARAMLAPTDYHVVVCGEFEVGKSALLSAMVSMPELFPNHPNEVTGVGTRLFWGARPVARVARSAGAGFGPEMPLGAVQRFIIEPEGASTSEDGRVVHVDMWAPVERLKSGVVLVDTPGLNGTNKAHDLNTLKFLAEADLVIFVTAVGKPLTTPQLAAVEIAAGASRDMFCVVTKTDLDDPDPYIAAARERIAERLGREQTDLTVLAVSARRALRADRSGSVARRAESNVDAVWLEIERRHDRWTATRTEAAIASLRTAINEISATLRMTDTQVDELLRQYNALQDLRANAPTLINQQLAEAAARIHADARQSFQQLREDVVTQTKLFSSYLEPDSYVRNFHARVTEIRTASTRALARDQEELLRHWTGCTQIRIEIAPPDDDRGTPTPEQLLGKRPPQRWFTIAAIREAASAGKLVGGLGSGFGSGLGTLLGAMVGGVVAPGIGAGIGLLLGQFAGWVVGLANVRTKALADFTESGRHELARLAPEWSEYFATAEDRWIEAAVGQLTKDLLAELRRGWAEQEALVHQAMRERGTDVATAARRSARLAELETLGTELTRVSERQDP